MSLRGTVNCPHLVVAFLVICLNSSLCAQPIEIEAPEGDQFPGFGYAISPVPDVNGDGRTDLVVGTRPHHEDSEHEDSAGRAYVYDGSAFTLIHSLMSPNPEMQGFFGTSVSGVDDVNGDGRGDVIVGAFYEDPGTSPRSAGRAYIFDGSNGSLLHELRSPNEEEQGYFGRAVVGIHDIDIDGRADVIVGAYGETPDEFVRDIGRAYIFSGSSGQLLKTLFSPTPREHGLFGSRASYLSGNLKGLGSLVFVGAIYEVATNGSNSGGVVHSFDGESGQFMRSYSSPTNEAGGISPYFGGSISNVPDVNGDGQSELLVAAYSSGGPYPVLGNVYVIDLMTGAALQTLYSRNAKRGGLFGVSICGLNDINGNGTGDVLVGASREDVDENVQNEGRVYIYDGLTGDWSQFVSPDQQASGGFGRTVGCAGDTNEDGLDDFFVGAPWESSPGTNDRVGKVYLFESPYDLQLPPTVTSTPTITSTRTITQTRTVTRTPTITHTPTITPTCHPPPSSHPWKRVELKVPDGFLGGDVAGVPDVDGDGLGDVVVVGYDGDEGVHILKGTNGSLLRSIYPHLGAGPVVGIPDLNGNGTGDIVVASYGFAFAFDGLTGSQLHALEIGTENNFFGYEVAGVPDTNGDDVWDILVANPDEGPGVVYLFDGSSGELLHRIPSPVDDYDYRFGGSLSGSSDVNGDGLGDVVVGTWQLGRYVIYSSGVVYIYDGANGTLLNTFSSPSGDSGGSFGISIAGMFDSRVDGPAKAVIGAHREARLDGKTYIVNLSEGGAIRTYTPPNPFNRRFGSEVAYVPDANGDGVGDVLVDNIAYSQGVHLFDGACGALLQTFVPSDEASYFVGRMAGVPDADGDGLGDVVIIEDSSSGLRVLLYLSNLKYSGIHLR